MSDVDEKRADVLAAHRDAAGAASHGDLVQCRVLHERFRAALDAYAAAVREEEQSIAERMTDAIVGAAVRGPSGLPEVQGAVDAALARAVATEREACAAVADASARDVDYDWHRAATSIAAAIRARGGR